VWRFHFYSLGGPTPPFPMEFDSPFSRASYAPNPNQLRPRLDLKAYPLEIANRERTPLLT
jgi:hypothetical protein